MPVDTDPRRAVVVVGCLAAIALSAATGCSGSPPAGVALPTSTPSTSDTPSASPAASRPAPSVAPPATAPIPDSAFFTPPANRTRIQPDKPQDGRGDLPSLCNAKYPSDKEIGKQRTRRVYFHSVDARAESIPSGTAEQTIAVYRSGGAAAAIADFRAAVTACPAEKLDTGATATYRFLAPSPVGNEALLIEQAWKNPPDYPDTVHSLLSIARTGDVVTILWVAGWEGIDADSGVTSDYTARAVAAIDKWRARP